ncbi:GAF domain-containing protein [Luteimonas terrae]|uniref:K+-sensing histidine kinase KdpD n=1 Tax=Luteimonas terrae TaxID=1530191 RepID=A0ABU1XUF9_9GAMM|nr:GAF domain-containing protein [Luteimonas terrae]MDR7192383.1 K+-sensing histidine kinase KdpD [Luteimonas terrae]
MTTGDRFFSESGNLADLAVASVTRTSLSHAFDELLQGLRRSIGIAHAQLTFDPKVSAWFALERAPETIPANPDGPDLTVVCRQVIEHSTPIEVADLAAHPVFSNEPIVTEAGYRFYSGLPLLSDSGRALGALCVMDTRPRTLDAMERALLQGAVRQASIQLELRRALESARRANRYRTRLNVLATRGFRGPLTTITTVLGELAGFSHSAEEKELLALALEAARTLETDFRQVAEATAEEADQDLQTSTRVALSQVFADLAHTMALPMRVHGTRLEVESTDIVLCTNAPLLLRALCSLVRVALERRATLVCVQCVHDADDLVLSVRARGGGDRSGMSDRDARGVAEDLAGLNPNGSLGLGTSIAKRSCDVLGYQLSVETALDVGSDYIIRIPATQIID